MSRKLPLCAVCGNSLIRCGQVHLTYAGLPGRPAVAWHHDGTGGCLSREEFAQELMKDLRKDSGSPRALARLREILAAIGRRGPGRLVVNRDWPGDLFMVAGQTVECPEWED